MITDDGKDFLIVSITDDGKIIIPGRDDDTDIVQTDETEDQP